MPNFQGEISSQSLVDVIQFYVQNSSCVNISIVQDNLTGDIWVDRGRVLHATTQNNYGIDAFYEILGWSNGKFKIYPNDKPEIESINKDWTKLILEYYVLVDEQKITSPSIPFPSKEKPKSNSQVDIKPIVSLDTDNDFSDLNDLTKPDQTRYTMYSEGTRKKSSHPKMKNFKEKLRSIFELDGVLAASIVDTNTGMPLIQESKSPINLESYCAYMVEVIKSHKKFLTKLNIKDKIEDIVINLDKNYHIITFVLKQDNLFIYVILDKENSNLGMTRLVLMQLEEELDI
jgi:predicted regulator of Ras-like GTPase activity (Roadblock/LC7/MglB family)